MTASQERALEELWPFYGIEAGEDPIDFDVIFGRQADRVLEIGFGNGDTLVQAAAQRPDTDFLGIEVHEPGIGHCMLMARENDVENLRVIASDAMDVLRTRIHENSLARINLYFPDPWPKKRHHKRRIVQPPFLELAASRLRPDGTLHIATDWQAYAEHIDETMAATDLFQLDERAEHSGENPLDRFTTKFERRGLRRGHRIWDWRFQRS
jgi:tRNA (guanine-N7-)-methyltransferase